MLVPTCDCVLSTITLELYKATENGISAGDKTPTNTHPTCMVDAPAVPWEFEVWLTQECVQCVAHLGSMDVDGVLMLPDQSGCRGWSADG